MSLLDFFLILAGVWALCWAAYRLGWWLAG